MRMGRLEVLGFLLLVLNQPTLSLTDTLPSELSEQLGRTGAAALSQAQNPDPEEAAAAAVATGGGEEGRESRLGALDLVDALRGEAGAGRRLPLCFAKQIDTGMGDRLSNILAVAALARALDRRVWVAWHTLPPGVESHRKYAWEAIAASVTLPAHVSVLSGLNASETLAGCPHTSQIRWQDPPQWEFPSQLMGADGIPQLANSIWRVPGEKRVDDAVYMAAYREVGAEFHVKEFYQVEQIPERYVVLHVRGTDKRAAPGRSFCTDAVLQELLECGVAVVAVSDDPEMLGGFRARHPGILTPPHHDPGEQSRLPKLEMELRDLSLLTRASAILQHSSEGYSAFGVLNPKP